MEVALIVVVIAVIFVVRTFKIVPQQHAWVVERLGRYDRTLTPGLKFVIPFVERVSYKHSLKEIPLDVPSQVCITKDNTQLQVDGILYFQITDAMRASYGSSNYVVAMLICSWRRPSEAAISARFSRSAVIWDCMASRISLGGVKSLIS